MRLLFLLVFFACWVAEASFFEQRYRGWFWFEKNEKKNKAITAREAREMVSNLKNELDDRRNIMIAQPNAENVLEYVIWEEKMWKNALMLDDAYREAKFKYPEYFPEAINVHAVKLKRGLVRKENRERIGYFASKYDLVFFSKADCLYSKNLAPILKNFAEEYKFNIEEASIDGKISGLFEGGEYKDLGRKLGIKHTPIIYAISKDKKKVFEMIRGMVSKSELEEYAVLAANFVGI